VRSLANSDHVETQRARQQNPAIAGAFRAGATDMPHEQWIGIGTALLLIGTGMVTWGTVKSMKIISDSTSVIKDATDNLQAQTQRIEGINNDIATKAGQISDLASESLNQLTSADSFCYVDASVNATDNSLLMLMLVHQGKYPLPDVSVEIRDINAAERFWKEFDQSTRKLSL
jgi:hypothetical protein